MKKRTGKLALALAALAMLVTTIGCKDPNNGIKTVEEETKSYTVTFNTNGGSAIEAVSVDEGNTLTLPDDPTKTGYDFKGWFTDEALSAEFDETVAITEDTTLYAKWSVIEYTITYVLNDDNATNAATNPAKYTIESEAITLAEPTTTNTEKPNFSGWYSDETLETVATGIAKGSTGNKTFYASWSDKVQYTVTFYNGADVLATIKVAEGGTITIPSTISVEGYTIEGWYTDADLTNAFDSTATVSADVSLYAKAIAKVTVKFVNGTTEVKSESVASGSKVTAPAAPEAKTGYTFGGWKAGDVTLAAGAESAAITADTTYEAVWTAITYKIKFDANGGSGEIPSITATYDQDVTLPTNGFTHSVYPSYDWNTTADGTGTAYASGASVKNLASTAGAEVTLYAQWYWTLWSGSEDLGAWAGSIVIDSSKLSALTTTSVIKITGTEESSATTEYDQIQLKANTEGWPALENTMVSNFSSLYPIFSEEATFVFDAEDLVVVKESGLVIGGQGITITKIEYLGEQKTETLAENVASYSSFGTRDALQEIIDKGISGYTTITFNCELAVEETNSYDYVAQLAGWDSEWENSTDSFDDYTFKLGGQISASADSPAAVGTAVKFSFNVESMLSDLENTDIFCINIWNSKITCNSVTVSYIEH